MRPVDTRLCRVDDDEHLCCEIACFAVEDHARNFDLIQQARILRTEELQARQAVLAIDNKESRLRILQIADRFVLTERPEFQNVFGKEQHASGDGWLCLRGLIEVDDLADLFPAQQPLEGLFAAFDLADKLGNGIFRIGVRFDGFALKIEAAGKTNAVEDVPGFERNKIEDTVLLTDTGCKHAVFLARMISKNGEIRGRTPNSHPRIRGATPDFPISSGYNTFVALRLNHLTDRQLLDLRLCDLPLKIRGTQLEQRIQKLYRELEARSLKFRPHIWLSEEWFTPDGVGGFAIPFYLAHPRLVRLERSQMLEVEGASEGECMRILRHEAGHAIDNAYRLHARRSWSDTFGSYRVPYPE